MTMGVYNATMGLLASAMLTRRAAEAASNLGTPGYKADLLPLPGFRTPFDRLLALRLGTGDEAEDGPHPTVDLSQGPLHATGRPTDLALTGPGFFQVQAGERVLLTRDGSFHVSAEGLLVTRDGLPVLGQSGPIRLGSGPVTVGRGGEVFQGGQVIDRLALVTLDDPTALRRVGATFFESSGATPRPAGMTTVHAGHLEAANVTFLSVVEDLTRAQVAYTMNLRALSTQDETLDQVVDRLMQR